MHGLTVRWSLEEAPEGVEKALADYVENTSYAGFAGRAGLRFKTWRLRPGEWFEGCYVFETPADREAFEKQFTAGAGESPGSKVVGSPPILIEPCEVVAVAEGGSGFRAAPTYC